jgi:hypothetical protein
MATMMMIAKRSRLTNTSKFFLILPKWKMSRLNILEIPVDDMMLNPRRGFDCSLSIQEDVSLIVCISPVHTIHNERACSKKCAYRVPVYSL